MMPDRKMFWRIIRRIFASNRARLLVILLALGAGAAVTAALLNLQVDAKRRLTTEFRAFGANVLITPRSDTSGEPTTLDQSILQRVPRSSRSGPTHSAGVLYAVIDVSVAV